MPVDEFDGLQPSTCSRDWSQPAVTFTVFHLPNADAKLCLGHLQDVHCSRLNGAPNPSFSFYFQEASC